ncbi:4Fe-4S binding protein [Methanobrevibacter smithii]|jgi:electron transport complex protein RnfB|uniref:4Fe-4S binding protein n=1 Tax=Methanobrevibacter smithii TaxID=2173 RepID=UPI00242B2C39|nr:4Fe-4S binding protein [Methanobrevibacter smithii]HJJ01726.1 4Fe-4S binding protein [Methanobrevibacter smithii]
MNISFDKQISSLEREILLKSVEIHDSGDDFQFELNKFFSQKEIIAIAPRCIRCNMCVDQCPVDAIEPANIFKIAKITPDCVKCEICVQTCPVSAIKLIDNKVSYNHDEGDEAIEYNLASISRPHRVVRMNDIFIDYSDLANYDNCAKFCPTDAFTLEFKSYFEELGIDVDIELENDVLYPVINKKLCIGCGACVQFCENDSVKLDRTIGPIVHTKNLEINQDECVNCYLCEENCPVEAIWLDEEKVVLNNDKCIRCINCTSHCPVGALNFVEID